MLKLQFKDNPARSYWLVGEQLSLGTASDCNVVLEGLGINSLHAIINIEGDEVRLQPCEDAPCYVNSVAVGEQLLKEGDELRIGKQRLVLIDPKNQSQDYSDAATAKPKKKTVWTLTAEHPKLKDRPFLITDRSVLGRSKHVNLFIPFKHLSREHAELRVEGDVLKLKDLGSSNGCFVNGERVQEYDLQGGETVSFAFLDFVVNSPLKPAEQPVSMDVTMVRSAVTQEDIERAQRESKLHSQSLDLSEIEDQREAAQAPEKSNNKLLLVIAVVVVAALAYGASTFLS